MSDDGAAVAGEASTSGGSGSRAVSAVAVFCGSSDRIDGHYRELAIGLGERLAAEDIDVVYGGGRTGLMGAVSGAAMHAGGRVVGVIPGGLFDNGVASESVTELEVVADMHERKARMYDLSDAFIGLPGGMGTFEEVFEAATWSQLGLHSVGQQGARKRVVLLDGNGYWDPVVELLDRASADGFMKPETRAIVCRATSIDDAMVQLSEQLS